MNNKILPIKGFEKEFYAYLGLLSVQFAKMEHKLTVILCQLLGNEDNLINLIVIENNTLEKNLDLLKKINKIRHIYPQIITELNEEIQKIKSERNLFIHGIWHEPQNSTKGIMSITCEKKKVRHTEEKNKEGRVEISRWSFNEFHLYYLEDFKKRIKQITDIIKIEDTLIKKLENENFN